MSTTFETSILVDSAAISAATEQIMEFLHNGGVDARAAHHVALAAEELLTNLATHGKSAGTPATLRLTVEAERVTAEIVDDGTPFDPRQAPDPDLSGGIMEREVGGLGLYLVRQFAESIDYARRGEKNFTTFAVARSRI